MQIVHAYRFGISSPADLRMILVERWHGPDGTYVPRLHGEWTADGLWRTFLVNIPRPEQVDGKQLTSFEVHVIWASQVGDATNMGLQKPADRGCPAVRAEFIVICRGAGCDRRLLSIGGMDRQLAESAVIVYVVR